jgi:hypothetical protein
VAPKVFLEGPYDATTGSMSDALRAAGLVPAGEPYTAMGYTLSSGVGAVAQPGVLSVTGNNAIEDWLVVELRDAFFPEQIVHSRPALLQRDGDVVDLDGVSPVVFPVASGGYHVAVRHRNHLAVMTATPVQLNPTPAASVNFTSVGTGTYGTNARKAITGAFPTQAMWAGDATFNGQLKYTGSNNDRDPILLAIGGAVPTNTVSGQYRREDVNMDGLVKYTGSSNDRDPILVNIGGTVPTAMRQEQMP